MFDPENLMVTAVMTNPTTGSGWTWRSDPMNRGARKLRLQLSDSRWTDIIFEPGAGVIEHDGLLPEPADHPELAGEAGIRLLTRQFLDYKVTADGFTRAEDVGGIVEPDFAWDLGAGGLAGAQRRLMLSDHAYRRVRILTIVAMCIAVAVVAAVLIQTGPSLSHLSELIPRISVTAPGAAR